MLRKSDLDGTNHFKRRFQMPSLLANVLDSLVENMLEKAKLYELSSMVFVQLLIQSKKVKSTKRGKWWVRLCIDFKHLRLRKDALKIAEVALQDTQWVKTGPKNQLLKMKAQLSKQQKNADKSLEID